MAALEVTGGSQVRITRVRASIGLGLKETLNTLLEGNRYILLRHARAILNTYFHSMTSFGGGDPSVHVSSPLGTPALNLRRSEGGLRDD